MTDDVNHPAHYNQQGIEVIDVIEAYELPYHLGNVIKYVCRHSYKGSPLKDLKKAQWYLTRHIEALQLEELDRAAQETQRQARLNVEQVSVGLPCVRKGEAHDFWGSGDLRKCINCGVKPPYNATTGEQAVELPLQGRVAGQAECAAYNTYYRYDPTAPDRACAHCDKIIAVGETKFVSEDVTFCSYSCYQKHRDVQLKNRDLYSPHPRQST